MNGMQEFLVILVVYLVEEVVLPSSIPYITSANHSLWLTPCGWIMEMVGTPIILKMASG